MATRLENLRKAAFCASILEQSIVEIEQCSEKGLAPTGVGNLRQRFDDVKRFLDDALKHARTPKK